MWITTEELNFVDAFPAGDANANTTCFPCRAVNMKGYDSMVAAVSMGAGSTYRIYVQCSSTAAMTPGTTGNLMYFSYRVNGQASTASTANVMGARSSYDSTASYISTGLGCYHDATTSPNCTAYLEIKADDADATRPYVAVVVSTSAQAHPLAVQYIMRPRYLQGTMIDACT